MLSKLRNSASPFSADTFVIAAVSVVLPWSTCPIVPTLQWGLVRSNFSLAIGCSLSFGRSHEPGQRGAEPIQIMALNRNSCGVFQDLFGAPPDYHTPLGYLKSRAWASGPILTFASQVWQARLRILESKDH